MISTEGFGFMLAFGIAFLNRAYNLLEQQIDSRKPSWKLKYGGGTLIVAVISYIFFMIIGFGVVTTSQ